jgi:hypothetical protein
MADPVDVEEIAFRRKAEPVIAEAEAEFVFPAVELLYIAFSADQVAVESFEQPNGCFAVERTHIGACGVGPDRMPCHFTGVKNRPASIRTRPGSLHAGCPGCV